MSIYRVLIVFLLALCIRSAYAAENATPVSSHITEAFLTALPGDWDGSAIETPVGPVDYAISFHLCDADVIAGVAELSVSDHHWRFWQSDGELRLTFLSTFRGNQVPTQLIVSKTEDNTIWFHAPEVTLLTLSVTLAEPNVDIRVFHHHKPHVYIRLTRLHSQTNEVKKAKNMAKSCRQL
ncbi:MAG: hypothetical protein WBO93_04285 [Gammaproteobacteria bacterium]